jgi:hypothetical protein
MLEVLLDNLMIARHACEMIAQALQVDYGATHNGGSIEWIGPPMRSMNNRS